MIDRSVLLGCLHIVRVALPDEAKLLCASLEHLLVCKKGPGQNLNKYTTLSTWRDYGSGLLGPPSIAVDKHPGDAPDHRGRAEA